MNNYYKFIFLIVLIVVVITACSKEVTNEIVATTPIPEITPVATEPQIVEWNNILRNGDILFNGNILFVAMENINSGDNIENYFVSKEKYDTLNIYNFGNDLEYTTEVIIIPRDNNVSLELCSVRIDEDGLLQVEKILDSGINAPFKFRYDDYESIMPQYGIIIENSPSSEIIPIVHSGMDGSLQMDSNYSLVIK